MPGKKFTKSTGLTQECHRKLRDAFYSIRYNYTFNIHSTSDLIEALLEGKISYLDLNGHAKAKTEARIEVSTVNVVQEQKREIKADLKPEPEVQHPDLQQVPIEATPEPVIDMTSQHAQVPDLQEQQPEPIAEPVPEPIPLYPYQFIINEDTDEGLHDIQVTLQLPANYGEKDIREALKDFLLRDFGYDSELSAHVAFSATIRPCESEEEENGQEELDDAIEDEADQFTTQTPKDNGEKSVKLYKVIPMSNFGPMTIESKTDNKTTIKQFALLTLLRQGISIVEATKIVEDALVIEIKSRK